MLYFAYGSNLCAGRLTSRIPEASYIATGFLPGHHLRFHKRGRDGTGKANAYPSGVATDAVWGALVELEMSQLQQLDQFEPGYTRVSVGIFTADRRMTSAQTYLAEVDLIDPALRPFDWYLDLVVSGARARGLPAGYTDDLRKLPCLPGGPPPEYDC